MVTRQLTLLKANVQWRLYHALHGVHEALKEALDGLEGEGLGVAQLSQAHLLLHLLLDGPVLLRGYAGLRVALGAAGAVPTATAASWDKPRPARVGPTLPWHLGAAQAVPPETELQRDRTVDFSLPPFHLPGALLKPSGAEEGRRLAHCTCP